jgi:Protein of unknown function (DUF2442)/Helix-turn-helix
MIKVRDVDARPGHKLAVRFSDGTRGVVDMSPLLSKAPFRALRDEAIFAAATIDHGAVEWPCEVGIAPEALYAMAHGLPKPETLEQARANELEMSLRELRQLAGVTQSEVSEAMGMDQGQLSRFERQEDRLLSTLRRYGEALGGELGVAAVLGDRRITLRGI